MSGCFTKMAISLELRMGHTHLMHQLKALIFIYPLIYHRCPSDLNQMKNEFKTYFLTFIF